MITNRYKLTAVRHNERLQGAANKRQYLNNRRQPSMRWDIGNLHHQDMLREAAVTTLGKKAKGHQARPGIIQKIGQFLIIAGQKLNPQPSQNVTPPAFDRK